MTALVDQLKGGLDAPICLTWELTYAVNLECVHCLSSSGRRDRVSSPPTKRRRCSTNCRNSRSSTSTSAAANR